MTEMNEGFFDDITDDMPIEEIADEMTDETELETEDETEVGTETETEVGTEPTEPFLKIKYDKEEIGLTQDEARELAEKGKNYDRIRDRYNSLNDQIERLARIYDMDVNTFLNSLSDSQKKFEIANEVQSLREQYPNADDGLLNEIATSRVNSRTTQREAQVAQEQTQKQDTIDAEVKRQVDLFRQEYPNLEPDKLDKQVYGYVKQGYTLLEAYSKWARNEQVKNKPIEEERLRARQLNEANRSKSYGDTSTVGSADVDDFMSGWFSE